ncbi:MAG: SusC/RagA family TonB-linked outer membrane protein, partial [Bacteroidales bacterium]|nr:SusC/RagA family TonB-linked outer membrane protein [Bacteroidales bacterium]
ITKSTSFKMNLSGYYSLKNTNYNADGHEDLMWASIYSMPPDIYTPQYSDGTWGWVEGIWRYNPVAVIYNMGIKQIRRTQLYSDFQLDQKLDFITKGLTANASLHYDNNVSSTGGLYDLGNSTWPYYATANTPFKVIDPKKYTGPDQDPSEYTTYLPTIGIGEYDWFLKPWTINDEVVSTSVGRRMTYQFQLNYARKFGLHEVSAMGVFKREESATGSNFPSYREDWVFRATYDYDTRYLLEVNGAYNGSEKFGPGYRFDFFPSLAAGWYVSNEKFFKLDWMNRLKFRFSTGLVGDDQMGDGLLYLSQYASGGYSRLNASPAGYSPYMWYVESFVGNPDIKWENAQKNNLGVEMGFLNDLFALNIDYFTEKRTDILLDGGARSIPPFFGAIPPPANLGRVNSNGYEVELKINKRFRGDLRLWSNISYSHNENKVMYKDDPYYKAAYLKAEGYSIGQVRTQVRTGFYNNWDEVFASVPTETNDMAKLPGYYNLLDYNADGVIRSTDDAVPYGYSDVPQNSCNFSLGFNYKRFSIMAQLYGASNVSRSVPLTSFIIQTDVVFEQMADYWSKDNQDATAFLPRWRTQGQNIGDYYLYDASYLRLKTVELAYTFDKNQIWLKKTGLSSLRIYVNGNNLLFWSDLPDDRESNSSGGSGGNGTYPTVKRVNFGIDVTF